MAQAPEQTSPGSTFKRRVALDLSIAAAVAMLAFVLASLTDAYEWFQATSRSYEYLELDEALVGVLAVGLGAVIFGVRRLKDYHREVHHRMAAERNSARLAMHDDLTGLPNRRLFRDRLATAMARAKRTHELIAVMVLDIDRFKPVNDLHGHGTGDKLLVTIARRFSGALREHDTLARVGGDEFTVCMVAMSAPSDALRVAERLTEALKEPLEIDGKSVSVGVSVGICLYDEAVSDPAELVRRASVAMRRAKQSTDSDFRFYETAMDETLGLRATLEREMRIGIAASEFLPYYQPIIDLASGRIVSFEALARWKNPIRGLVAPDVFIPIAEDSNQIMALSDSILRQACRDARSWPEDIMVSVNISPLQFRNRRLDEEILQVLEEEGLPPSRLEVEVTENALVDDPEWADTILHKLKAQGVHTALDDFGTGHSSLVRLRDLAFDKIKIDRSFITDLPEDLNSSAIVEAVLALGRSLKLPTAAEGIEHDRHLTLLRDKGCALGQGYHFSRPVPAAEVPRLIDAAAIAASPEVAPLPARSPGGPRAA